MLRIEGLYLEQSGFELGADFVAQSGQRLAILGPSGAGKSSLLAAIGGFFTPKSGHIYWEDQELTSLRPSDRPVSFLFQDQNLFAHLTIEDNLWLALSGGRGRKTAGQADQITDALEKMGLSGYQGRRPGALSGGQVARAALSMVLLRARPIILLDEPFAALGPGLKQEMLSVVRDVAAQTQALVLLVTHQPQDALDFATDSIFIDAGRTSYPKNTKEFFAHPSPELQDYLGK
ncbi:MAG: ATP-binding cassette domain-containing protein [Paracoccaceae bacterium]|jgi:thiamine transport system ATP-binding protein